jgi:hypothetical protein
MTNLGLRDDVLNARNAFARERTPEQFRRFSGNISGPLRKDRTSLLFSVDGNLSYDSQTIVAQLPSGRVAEYVRRPIERAEVTVGVEHALSASQTLRVEYQHLDEERRNLGLSDFSLPDRAFTRTTGVHQVRGSATSVIGKSALNELRVEFRAEDTSQRSRSQAPTIIVIDAFNSGGAGVHSDRVLHGLQLTNDTDFTIGRHAIRAGVRAEGGGYRQFDRRNANGTFTFPSLDAYEAGLADTFTQRNGSVETTFPQYQVGVYVQDDIKVNRDLSIGIGVREELQTHLADRLNLMPRAGFTWNPFGWKTAVRGGFGVFHDWLSADLYDQSLRVDGVSQRDLLILDPGYPDPIADASAVVLPGGRIELAPDLQMPQVRQWAIGAERTVLGDLLGLQASYMRIDGRQQFRSVDLNAPDAAGARPNPSAGTVTQVQSTGRSEIDRLLVNATFRVPRQRIMMGMHYILAGAKNHTDSPLALPADSRAPDTEWGPSAQDVRHRLFVMANVPLPKGIRANVMSQAQSGAPYTITTGADDNRDGVSNDRPAGVGRNSARGTWRWDLNLRISRGFGFGGERQSEDGGAVVQRRVDAEGGGPVMMMMERTTDRFRVDFYVQGYNLLNRSNYLNYSGSLQSPFFGQPTSAGPARRVEVGLLFAF